MWQSLFVLFISFSWLTSAQKNHEKFLQCLSLYSGSSISKVIFTPTNSSFSSVLEFNVQNLRFDTISTPKPLVIVTPTNESHIQATIFCARRHNLQARIRSGGHDVEGLSYLSYSPLPFVIIDLVRLRTVKIDSKGNTAWIQAGATLGEVYHTIAEHSRTLAFPAGLCPTVGVGGHFSGGGYGTLMRKYGLAADNVIDAHLIDVNGRIHDRASMGEDLFWAIRGGGGNTFGVVVAWKVKLVQVPSTVTIFTIQKASEQNAIELANRWQYVANKLPNDIFLQLLIRTVSSASTPGGNLSVTVRAEFNAMFLGGIDRLLPLMQDQFPELGLAREDCAEMSWIEAQANFAMVASGFPIDNNISLDFFTNRTDMWKERIKEKSDYVMQPVPEKAFRGIWKRLQGIENVLLALSPYGGKMSEISDSSTPFPHRAGNLYKIGYGISWDSGDEDASQRNINWMRGLYKYMTPFVSKDPRSAYVNHRDLDIGMNNVQGKTSYEQARIWGSKYYRNNFDRLVRVKTKVDPTDFFRNEQSIPPVSESTFSEIDCNQNRVL